MSTPIHISTVEKLGNSQMKKQSLSKWTFLVEVEQIMASFVTSL